MATLPKEVREKLIEDLSGPFGSVHLDCDGYRISLQVRMKDKSGMRYVVCLFVNGVFEGKWVHPEPSHPEQKFLRRVERFLFSPKEREHFIKMEVLCGTKRKEAVAKANRKFVLFDYVFSTPRSAINHLLRACDSVALAPVETPARHVLAPVEP